MTQDPRLRDFRNFLILVWARLGLPSPTPVQLDIADFLQHGPKRRIIQAFRGVGKSWITSAYVAWRLYWQPKRNIMVVSASRQRADQFSTFVFQLFAEVPELQHMQPQSHQRTSKVAFDVRGAGVSHSPSVLSVGISGQMTGNRADTIIGDDVEVPNNSYSDGERAKLLEAVKEFDSILKPSEDAEEILLGTPQTEESMYRAMSERGWTTRIWPARVPDEEVRKGYLGLAPMIEAMENVGAPTDPQRFDADELLEREASIGRSTFALQFMLDTSLSDRERYPLRLGDLVVMGLDPTEGPDKVVWASGPDQRIKDLECVGLKGDCYHAPLALQKYTASPYEGAVLAVDPSGRGADETGYAIVKNLHGRLYVTAAGGLPGGYDDEALDAILRLAKVQKVGVIIVEPNFGDGMYTRMLQSRVLHVQVEVSIQDAPRNIIQKERRIIESLEPIMNQHRLVVCRSVIEGDFRSTRGLPPEQALRRQLFYQMSRLTVDRGSLQHDDRLDALAIAVRYWTDRLGVSPEAQNQKASYEWMIGQIEKDFIAMGQKPRQKGMANPSRLPRVKRPRFRR